MLVRHKNDKLDRLEIDPAFDGGFAAAVVKAYRKVMGYIRAADDERAFYGMKSLRFEKLQGQRSSQRSMRLNDQWRLIIEMEGEGLEKTVVVIDIEDYH